jgi:hypothetical protein
MVRPSKLNLEVQQRIGDNIALGLTYRLAAEAAGITYKTLNQWVQRGKNSTSGEYFEFYKFIQKCNADAAKTLLERLKLLLTLEIAKCACGSWRDVSAKISAGGYIEKQMLYQKT